MDIIQLSYGKNTPVIRCLDHGFVRLIDCSPRILNDGEVSADYAIAEAARCSYMRGNKTVMDDRNLIRYLMRHKHTSPFEMITFKFHWKLPIFVARQVIRHRTASLNELSGRYSELPEEYFMPTTDGLRAKGGLNKQGSSGSIEGELIDERLKAMGEVQKQCFEVYHDNLDANVAREIARCVLPVSTYTEWYWQMDLHNLLHFMDLRCDSHAQQETRVFAEAVLELIRPIVPITIEAWEDYSPYRGGMMLTRMEVEALKAMLVNSEFQPVESGSKTENAEWKDKVGRLGIGFSE